MSRCLVYVVYKASYISAQVVIYSADVVNSNILSTAPELRDFIGDSSDVRILVGQKS
jgi:hypothetical protein